VLPEPIPVWAVDANASFARPGPRLVDGVEALAQVIAQTLEQPARTVEGAAQRIR